MSDLYPQPRRHPPAKSVPPPKPSGAAWYLRPLYSRGSYSPRLTMAWLVVVFALWLIRRWITTPAQILNGILVQPPGVTELVVALLSFAGLLLGLGTIQKIQLGDAAPSPGAIESDSTDTAKPEANGNTSA